MNKTQTVILSALMAVAAIPAAQAQTLYTFSWSETGSSPYGNASGSLTLSTDGSGPDSSEGIMGGYFNATGYDYGLTAFTGAFTSGSLNGETISLYDSAPPANEVSEGGFDIINLSTSPPSVVPVGGASLYFTTSGSGDLFALDSNNTGTGYQVADITAESNDGNDLDGFTISAVPEPGTWVSAALMLGMVGFSTGRSWWRKRQAQR